MKRKITKDAVKHVTKVLKLYKEQNKIDQNLKNKKISEVADYEDLLDKRHFESWAQSEEVDIYHNHPRR